MKNWSKIKNKNPKIKNIAISNRSIAKTKTKLSIKEWHHETLSSK